jgi:hypothetical protein
VPNLHGIAAAKLFHALPDLARAGSSQPHGPPAILRSVQAEAGGRWNGTEIRLEVLRGRQGEQGPLENLAVLGFGGPSSAGGALSKRLDDAPVDIPDEQLRHGSR